jgi:hypothetical protein
METGKESNSHLSLTYVSGFMNQLFDSEATAGYTLFLLVAPGTLIALIKDNQNRILAGEHHQLSLDNDQQLKKAFSHSEALNHLFGKTIVHVCLPDLAITPIVWLESNEDENMLTHVAGDQLNHTVLTTVDSKNKWIFGVPNSLYKLIISTYKNVQWAPTLVSKANLVKEDLVVIVFENQLLLFDTKSDNQLSSWTTYDQPQSVLFALLSYCEINEIQPTGLTIHLIAEHYLEIRESIQAYFKQVSYLTDSSSDELSESYLFNFLNSLNNASN